MPIRGSPNGAGYLRPQAGRDCPESVSRSIVTAGRNQSEWPVAIARCAQQFGQVLVDVPCAGGGR